MSFVNGQALGTGPSFASFSIAHHFIMRSAIAFVHGSNDPVYDLLENLQGRHTTRSYNYFIVGDDIVMEHKYVSEYLRQCEHYGMPISVDKCLFDTNLAAEFCSRVITRDKIMRQYKWSQISDKNFLDYAKMLGPKAMPLFRKKQQDILNHIAYIPDIIKGPVSWNPEGIPLEVRIDEYWEIAERLFGTDLPVEGMPADNIPMMLKAELGQLISFRRPHPNHPMPSASTSRQGQSDNPVFMTREDRLGIVTAVMSHPVREYLPEEDLELFDMVVASNPDEIHMSNQLISLQRKILEWKRVVNKRTLLQRVLPLPKIPKD